MPCGRYRQQRQMQGGEAAETGAAPTTAPPTAPWSSQPAAGDKMDGT